MEGLTETKGACFGVHEALCIYAVVVQLGVFVRLLTVGVGDVSDFFFPALGNVTLLLGYLVQP